MSHIKHPVNRLQRIKLKIKDEKKNEKRKAGRIWNKTKSAIQERETEDELQRAKHRVLYLDG